LTETLSRLTRDLQLLQSEQEHLAKANDKLTKDNKDKMNLISQLESVRSSSTDGFYNRNYFAIFIFVINSDFLEISFANH
jgi:uncharacterized membrane-anchored protein YhcB (DUF1043 family)